MTIARVLARRPDGRIVSASADMTAAQAVALLATHRIGALPVLDGDRVSGIFSERDVIYCLAKEGAATLERPVREVMTAPAITVTPETDVIAALSLMTERRVRHLPVLQAEAIIGFVSIGDLVKHRLDAVEREAEAMRNYIQAV